MGQDSKIEWTDATWPVVQGCDYESPGCQNCYAVPLVHRMAHNPNAKVSLPLAGLVERRGGRLRWTGKVALRGDRLNWPLKWKKPQMVFVPSHGDLFHEDVPDEFIDQVFAAMALCPHHTFQVLTKRAARLAAYFQGRYPEDAKDRVWHRAFDPTPESGLPHGTFPGWGSYTLSNGGPWPLPNVWLGVSVEDRKRWDERIPHLKATPAAVRFVSVEPLLADLGDISRDLRGEALPCPDGIPGCEVLHLGPRPIHWVIVGGESGGDARECHLDWFRNVVAQCKVAGVAVFMKQVGARPTYRVWHGHPAMPIDVPLEIRNRKGGDPAEWPKDLRVRETPNPIKEESR